MKNLKGGKADKSKLALSLAQLSPSLLSSKLLLKDMLGYYFLLLWSIVYISLLRSWSWANKVKSRIQILLSCVSRVVIIKSQHLRGWLGKGGDLLELYSKVTSRFCHNPNLSTTQRQPQLWLGLTRKWLWNFGNHSTQPLKVDDSLKESSGEYSLPH